MSLYILITVKEFSVCEYAFFSMLAYQRPDVLNRKTFGYALPEGWSVRNFSSTSILQEIGNHGYFGIAFHKGNNVIFAHRGSMLELESQNILNLITTSFTVMNDLSLIIDDLEFTQFKYAKDFIENTLQKLEIDGYNVRYSFTGHSLGAAIGEISAVYYGKKAVLFENPGAKKVIDNEGYKRYQKFDIKSYQGPANAINLSGESYGEQIRVYDNKYSFNGDVFRLFHELLSDLMDLDSHSLDRMMLKLGCDPYIDV